MRTKKIKLTQCEVKRIFDYDPKGFLIKKVKTGNRCSVGKRAGSLNINGYHLVYIHGEIYRVHRVIFLWHYGYLPENDLDHINRDKEDNRIENLREVSRSCNMSNRSLFKNNKTGITGVSVYKKNGKFVSHIRHNKKSICLGYFDDIIEAAAHRFAAEQCSGLDICTESTANATIKSWREG